MKTETRVVMERLVRAASRVPIVNHGTVPPFFVCLGCRAEDSAECAPECWVMELECALFDAREELEWDTGPRAKRGANG